MNIQNTIVFILGFTILTTTMLIIIVGFLGVLRVMIMSVFEYDFVKSYKEKRKAKKQMEEDKYAEATKNLGYYVPKENKNV